MISTSGGCVVAASGHDGKNDDEIRAELGDKFPKHINHSIICIGALIAHTGVETFELIANAAKRPEKVVENG